jgi:hypothetical protein
VRERERERKEKGNYTGYVAAQQRKLPGLIIWANCNITI